MSEKKYISVHITEHHQSVVTGYQLWLAKEPDIKYCGTADHPQKTLKSASRLSPKPDVFVLDYSFQNGETILPFVPEFRAVFPDAALMVVTGFDMPHIIRSIYHADIDGIITKDNGADGFIQCIRALASGGVYYSRTVRQYVEQKNSIDTLLNALTATEQKVMNQLATGQPDKKICETLKIAPSTLDNHRTQLFIKMREHGYAVFSKVEMVVWYNNYIKELS